MNLTPIHKSATLSIFSVSTENKTEIAIVDGTVSAGFPSPAADFIESKIDLNNYLIRDENTTFIAQVEGYSMQGAGISHKDH